MAALAWFEFLFAVMFVTVVVNELVVPLWKGTKLFPSYRRQAVLRDQLRAVTDELELVRLEQIVAARREELATARAAKQSTNKGGAA